MHSIVLQRDLINKLFPFFLHFNKELRVVDCGDSLRKLLPDAVGKSMDEICTVQRPSSVKADFFTLRQITDKLVVLTLKDKRGTSLRGQFEYMEDAERFLFVGSPWFSSIEQLTDAQLSLRDFAYHDQMIDLLHLIKSQEITTNDLTALLKTISKQKNTLLENEQRLRVLSQIAEDNINAVIIADAEGRITWANRSFSSMTGYSPEEYAGKKPGHLLQGADSDPETIAYLKFQLTHALPFNAEILNYSKNGKEYWVRIQGQPIFNNKNELAGFFAIEENITGERKIQEQLLDSERKLRLSLEKIGDNVWEYDFRTNITSFSKSSDKFIDQVGSSGDDKTNWWWSHVHPQDRHILEENDLKIRSGEADSHNLRYRMVEDDGSVRWVLDRGVVIEKDEKGLPVKMIGTHTDITKMKETEAELAARVSQFKSLSENIPAVIYEYIFRHDGTHGMKYVSPSMESIFGIPAEDFKNDPAKFVHPDDMEMLRIENEKSSRYLKRFSVEARLVLPSGRILWHHASSAFAQRTEEGDLIFSGIMLNTTDQKNAEDALRANEEKYRNIISNMNLGLLEVTTDETITFANESFARMTGYSIEEMLGKKASELFLTNNTHLGVINEKSEIRKQGFSDAYEIRLYDRNRNPRWVMISGAPRYNDKGEFIGSIGIHIDITEQKKLEELLVKAKEEALELARAKELFLANMSHEIRTPLNAVIGMVRELRYTSMDSYQMQLVKNADASSAHLLSLMNNVLDLSKINSGNFELESEIFRWSDLFEEVKSITQKSASDKLIDLIFDNQIDPHDQFKGDAGRIRQILINVIGNAVKFTKEGYVLVRSKKGKVSMTKTELLLSIIDTGIGMEPAFLNLIFEKFTQENNSIQRKYGGTGLGMSITKQLAELMDGRIEVKSEPGRGTQFNIYLTIENAEPAQDISSPEAKTEISLEGKNVLVVEDNEMNRLVAKGLLVRQRINVSFAENGLEALNQLNGRKFDLILMDLQMPVMDGLEAAKRIRQIPDDTPIIALTANAFKNEIDRALQCGMNDFVSKPFDEGTLLKKMKMALSHTTVNGVTHTAEPEIKAALVPQNLVDESYLDGISPDNIEFKKEIFKIFLSQSENFIAQTRIYLDNKKWLELGRLAHQFKPQGSYIGVNELTKQVALVEKGCAAPDAESLKKTLEVISELILRVRGELEVKLRAWEGAADKQG